MCLVNEEKFNPAAAYINFLSVSNSKAGTLYDLSKLKTNATISTTAQSLAECKGKFPPPIVANDSSHVLNVEKSET